MFRSMQADQILFQQVLSFTGLLFLALVEAGLGQAAVFYGSAPKLVFCVLFVLGIRFPKAVPILPMMVVGLVFDLSQNNPMGLTSSQYLIVLIFCQVRHMALVEAQANSVWSEFVVMMFMMMAYVMVVFTLYTGVWPPFSEMIFQIGLTILIFPTINWVFDLYKNISFYLGNNK